MLPNVPNLLMIKQKLLDKEKETGHIKIHNQKQIYELKSNRNELSTIKEEKSKPKEQKNWWPIFKTVLNKQNDVDNEPSTSNP